MVHVVGRSKLPWRGRVLVILYPSFVLAPAMEEEDGDAYEEQKSAGNAYRDADYGAD